MCGISGFISKKASIAPKALESINSELSHRGPDEEGYYYHKNLGLGHKRLSIIDITSGKQPMRNETEDLIISYNGELYNFLELKKDLVGKGRTFETSSDTEVVLKAYEYYGNDCVKHFRGMFSFAIINKKKQEVFIARDQLGIKPIVYYSDDNCFAWASEIKALKALNNFKGDIDFYAIDQYLKFQFIPAPRTSYRKVKKLPPASFMVVAFNGEIKTIKKYWSLDFKKITTRSEKNWLSLVEDSIRDSIRAHTVSDVEFGAFLSGGVDSTLVVKYMTELLGKGVKTYSIGFKDSKANEMDWARQASKVYSTDHTELTLEGNALEILPILVKHYGEPFGDFSSVPTFYVSELASKDVKMVLSGDGADEIFVGYSHYPKWYNYINNDVNKTIYNNSITEKVYPYLNKILPRRYPMIKRPLDNLNDYTRYRSRMNKESRAALWKTNYKFLTDLPDELVINHENGYLSNDEFVRSQYFDINVFMPGDILTKVDIASMINSLEVRTPLTDIKVYELAASIPTNQLFKMDDKGFQGKILLKKLLEKDFDNSFINRKKQGFEIPLEKWLFSQDNYNIIKSRFLKKSGMLLEFFERTELERILEKKNGFHVWLLLILDEWFNQL